MKEKSDNQENGHRPPKETGRAGHFPNRYIDGGRMNMVEDKIDEYTPALLCLVIHERHDGYGAWVWKGFDGDTLNSYR